MKSQSSVEFLSTYSFVLLIIGLAVALIFFLVSYTGSIVSSQCTSFSELGCNFVGYYPNTSYGYGIISLSIANSQEAPINITSMNFSIGNESAGGICSPNFLYPSQEATCTGDFAINAIQSGSPINGEYYINAGICASQANALNISGCSYLKANYSGDFQVYSANNDTMPFSVIVAYAPSSVQLPSMPAAPVIPSNYMIAQNGDWIPMRNLTGFKYAYGTGNYLRSLYFGLPTSAYPAVVSALNSNTVPCASPYDSVVSVAYSSFYMPKSSSVKFSAYSDNTIGVYYRQAEWSGWINAFGSSGWNLNSYNSLLTNTNTLSTGLYMIAVEQVNTCGEGLEAVSVNGIGQ